MNKTSNTVSNTIKAIRSHADGRQRINFVQIEITTVCNFNCFYCAGRDMPKRHMESACFKSILKHLPRRCLTVSLQGEGEPTLHPDFWKMVMKVAVSGHWPYTITNCSSVDAPASARLFPKIGVSLDTLDREEAEKIGRFGLPVVLSNLERLAAAMGPKRIIIHTVDYGQPLEDVQRYVHSLGPDRHIVQPIQRKDDYGKRYPQLVRRHNARYHFFCRYIFQPSMLFFDINGTMMPCSFIKDTKYYVSFEHIRSSLSKCRVPICCQGCREIIAEER